jgi:hypothetical protein
MQVHEWQELCADARRLRISVGKKHLCAIMGYMRTRGVPYSPEYLKTWRLFSRNHGVLYEYWDVVGRLYRTLAATGENELTRSMGLQTARERLHLGYIVPATLGDTELSPPRRKWLVRQMLRHPLLIKEWVFACADHIQDSRTPIGTYLLRRCPS